MPEAGAGLDETQFQVSPPEPAPHAPFGSASSTHTVSVEVDGAVGVVGVVGVVGAVGPVGVVGVVTAVVPRVMVALFSAPTV